MLECNIHSYSQLRGRSELRFPSFVVRRFYLSFYLPMYQTQFYAFTRSFQSSSTNGRACLRVCLFSIETAFEFRNYFCRHRYESLQGTPIKAYFKSISKFYFNIAVHFTDSLITKESIVNFCFIAFIIINIIFM